MGIGLGVFKTELVGANTKRSLMCDYLYCSRRGIRIIVNQYRRRMEFIHAEWTTEFA
jgi:hypothetical protein